VRAILALLPGVEVHHLASVGSGPVFGFWEGARRSLEFRGAVAAAEKEIAAAGPAVAVLVGYSSFHIPLGRCCRRMGVPVVFMGAPQFWAWGRVRARRLKRAADLVLCLFPFEVSSLRKVGVNAVHVGHPLVDCSTPSAAVGRGSGRLALLSGSRPQERAFHLPLFRAVAHRLRESDLVDSVVEVQYAEEAADIDCVLQLEERLQRIAACDAALVVSGTATLETALLGVPQVVSYHLSPVTGFLARALVRLKSFSLPNILLGEAAVPEFLEPTEAQLVDAAVRILRCPDASVRARSAAERLAAMLGPTGACRRLARLVLDLARSRQGNGTA